MKKNTWGGKRQGASPPKKPDSEKKTETLKFMVTKKKKEMIGKKFPKKIIHNMFAEWTDEILKDKK